MLFGVQIKIHSTTSGNLLKVEVFNFKSERPSAKIMLSAPTNQLGMDHFKKIDYLIMAVKIV